MSKQSEHNRGQEDGAKAGALDQVVENLNPFSSGDYKAGFRHGAEQQGHANPDRDSGGSGGSSSSGGSGGSSGSCLVTTACVGALGLPDDCPELRALRLLRDRYVRLLPNGGAEIQNYYRLAPSLIRAVNGRPDAGRAWRLVYDEVVKPCADLVWAGRFAEAFELYKCRVSLLARSSRGWDMRAPRA